MAHGDLAKTFKEFGFKEAAKTVPHWEHTRFTQKAWSVYRESGGDKFLHVENGRIYEAPKVLKKAPILI